MHNKHKLATIAAGIGMLFGLQGCGGGDSVPVTPIACTAPTDSELNGAVPANAVITGPCIPDGTTSSRTDVVLASSFIYVYKGTYSAATNCTGVHTQITSNYSKVNGANTALASQATNGAAVTGQGRLVTLALTSGVSTVLPNMVAGSNTLVICKSSPSTTSSRTVVDTNSAFNNTHTFTPTFGVLFSTPNTQTLEPNPVFDAGAGYAFYD